MPRQKKIRTLNDILVLAKTLARRRTLVLAGADQEEGLKSVNEGRRHGFIEPLLIGDKQQHRAAVPIAENLAGRGGNRR